MKAVKLVIDHHQWMLPKDVDVDALKAEVDRLVKNDGGLIHFNAAGDRAISALVTNGIPVYFEVVEIREDYDDHHEGGAYDLDEYEL